MMTSGDIYIERDQWYDMDYTEAANGSVPLKKVYLKFLQNSQENTCAKACFLIETSDELY